jgi:putative DNA primase/helicase
MTSPPFDPAAWQNQYDALLAALPYPHLQARLRANLYAELKAEFRRCPQDGTDWVQMARVIGPVTWSWPGWLPSGLLTILAGESGSGKSILALRLAACFLRGDSWPDGTTCSADPGKVLWCEAEAAQAINLERAKAWHLPGERLLSPLDDPLEDVRLDEPEHILAVTTHAHREDVSFVVVDSLSGLRGGDENKTEMLDTVKMMAELARNARKPILLTHHLRKRGLLDVGEGGISLDRLRGSSAIVQTARLVWALDTPDPGRPDVRRLSVIKSNLARFPEPLGLTIGDEGLAFVAAPETPKTETLQDRAADLLLALLADGPVASAELKEEFEGAGISWHAAYRAKPKLRIVNARRNGRWYWSLPAHEEEA